MSADEHRLERLIDRLPSGFRSKVRFLRLARRPTKVAAIALANKLARMAWADGEGRALQESRRACGVTRSRWVARCEGWEGIQHVMQSRSIRRSGQPLVPPHSQMRAFDRDLISGGHYGQRSCEPHLKGRTHGRTDQCCEREESACQLGSVHTSHSTEW